MTQNSKLWREKAVSNESKSGFWKFLCTGLACATLIVCCNIIGFSIKYESDWRIRTMYAQYDMQVMLLQQQQQIQRDTAPKG